MLSHLPATDALTLLHAELGAPPLVVLDPDAGPRRLRSAVQHAAAHPDGSLLAVLVPDAAAAALPRTWLATGPDARVELQTVPVAEGLLLLARVEGAGRESVPARRRTAPAQVTTADAAPLATAMVSDLDDRLLRKLLSAELPATQPTGRATSNEHCVLARVGILAPHRGVHRPTLAALVVAGLRPDLHLSGCALELTAEGTTRMLRGPLSVLLRDLDRALPNPKVAAIVLEAGLNALLHRDWSDPAPVRLDLSDDRLVVAAPGRLHPRARREPHHPNALLVRFAVALGLARGDGHGLRDVAQRLSRAGCPPFSLIERDGAVTLVADLPRAARPHSLPQSPRNPPRTPRTVMRSPSSVAPVPADVPAGPPQDLPQVPAPPMVVASAVAQASPSPATREAAVLALLHDLGPLTTRQLADALGCSRPVVGKVLTALVRSGAVVREVASARSPFQRYRAVDCASSVAAI